jgi:hypothetical protein
MLKLELRCKDWLTALLDQEIVFDWQLSTKMETVDEESLTVILGKFSPTWHSRVRGNDR